MRTIAPPALLISHSAVHHRPPTGWLIALLLVVGLLYLGWRTGRLGGLRGAVRVKRIRQDLRGLRVRPMALVPSALLLLVVVLLLINR